MANPRAMYKKTRVPPQQKAKRPKGIPEKEMYVVIGMRARR